MHNKLVFVCKLPARVACVDYRCLRYIEMQCPPKSRRIFRGFELIVYPYTVCKRRIRRRRTRGKTYTSIGGVSLRGKKRKKNDSLQYKQIYIMVIVLLSAEIVGRIFIYLFIYFRFRNTFETDGYCS